MYEQAVDVLFNRKVTTDTWLLGLRSSEIAGDATPGQFVMIRVRKGVDPLLRRPFSICGVKEDGFFVLYRVVGRGTAIMTEIGEGETLSVLGPLGRGFDLPKANERPVLVGGGIGVAPLLFLGQVINDPHTAFMAGFGTAVDIIRPARIGLPPVDLTIATDDGTAGYAGLVTDLLQEVIHEKGSVEGELSVFACGPKPMLKKVAAMTLALEVSCQICLEANMACGLGACQGCGIHAAPRAGRAYYHVCQDGPVFPVGAIHWHEL